MIVFKSVHFVYSLVILVLILSVAIHGSIIIIEDAKACFRRTLAGKRVVRGLVRKLLLCDTAEQCQHECGDERHFTCEGFNYRLDPTGRGKGECELLDLPITKIDLTREVLSDPDYDYYTRDRNAVAVNCRQPPSNSYRPSHDYDDRRPGNGYDYRDDTYDKRPVGPNYPIRRPPIPWDYDYGRRPLPYPIIEEERRPNYDNRRGDYSFHHHQSHESHHSSFSHNEHLENRFDFHGYEDRKPFSSIHYLPASQVGRPLNDFPPYGTDTFIRPIQPSSSDRFLEKPPIFDRPYSYQNYRPPLNGHNDKNYWGIDNSGWESYGGHYGNILPFKYDSHRFNQNRNEKPREFERPKNWGLYGGSYGTGGLTLEYLGYGNRHAYSYWGFDKYHDDQNGSYLLPPKRKLINKPITLNYLPSPTAGGDKHYLPSKPLDAGHDLDNSILPLEHKRPSTTFDSIQDECSLRTAAGFRLHKRIVKKYISVPNIYECELLCLKEKEFLCASYAFRYSINLRVPTDNCYLSNRNYKELDYYTDMEPDKDFDVYTMNNRKSCTESSIMSEREDSDCFWRVRSGHRLAESVARDSLNVKSIVDCQLECLNSRKFACRAYSFRYGSPVIGGIIDNCQLTDWPFFELDIKKHFIPDPNFEIYDRGSYGHGCEANHFGIRGKPNRKDNIIKLDNLCYIGFGSPAKLLPQATIKSLFVPTELDCKIECSKAREGAYFRCVSFSFRTEATNSIEHNCYLSDIMQRDLLPNIDYIYDPTSWLFMWDDYNPECLSSSRKSIENQVSEYKVSYSWKYDLDTWSIYSVSGQPCKRGTKCRQNKIAGFWYCDLEGPDHSAWDYCCSPDHRCGLSKGYRYTWCYVGPQKTQWRKCNDYYYPYVHSTVDRFDKRPEHYPNNPPSVGFRPNRPKAPPRPLPMKPSLNEYEEQFDNEFLGPPKPGGFGRARRWPISYLHKESPLNDTNNLIPMETEQKRSKISAIQSLINVIKNNDFNNLQYHIVNDSDKSDDVLFVKIPLPNFNETTATNSSQSEVQNKTERSKNSAVKIVAPLERDVDKTTITNQEENLQKVPIFRKGFVTRTNTTNRIWGKRAFDK